MSDNTTPDTQSFVVIKSIYICLITLELASIAIKCQGSVTNPFQEQGPSMLIFLIALFCHAIALKAKISLPTTAIIIHVSGVTACETLLWILVAKFWWCIIINIVLLLLFVALFFYKNTCQLLTKVITPCFSWIKETYRKVGWTDYSSRFGSTTRYRSSNVKFVIGFVCSQFSKLLDE